MSTRISQNTGMSVPGAVVSQQKTAGGKVSPVIQSVTVPSPQVCISSRVQKNVNVIMNQASNMRQSMPIDGEVTSHSSDMSTHISSPSVTVSGSGVITQTQSTNQARQILVTSTQLLAVSKPQTSSPGFYSTGKFVPSEVGQRNYTQYTESFHKTESYGDSGHVTPSPYDFVGSPPVSHIPYSEERLKARGELKHEENFSKSCQYIENSASSTDVSATSTVISQSASNVALKVEPHEAQANCKFSLSQARLEESQNVLLKQLLQNTGCAQNQSQTSAVTTQHAPPPVPSLEEQLAKPVPPIPYSILPPILSGDGLQTTKSPSRSRDSAPLMTCPSGQSSEKKAVVPTRTPSRDELLSPMTPATPRSLDSSHHTASPLTSPQAGVKKEMVLPLAAPLVEIKKEPGTEDMLPMCDIDVKDVKLEMPQIKVEVSREEGMDLDMGDRSNLDQAALDLKKLKRRQYAQKRRQSLGKEAASGGVPKKRQRKGSKVEEDYDSFVENLQVQMQQNLPPLPVMEPELQRNHGVCPVFGAGDLSKIGNSKQYNTRHGDLTGEYGRAVLPHVSDYYNTEPYGELKPVSVPPPPTTQRGFYSQEFSPIKFDSEGDEKKGGRDRNVGSPDSIVSSSSPECVVPDLPAKFPCLFAFDGEERDKEDEGVKVKRKSPVIPLVIPTPIRLKPSNHSKNLKEVDKENTSPRDHLQLKARHGVSPLRDSGNVTVTLTLTSAAAEDILGVLRDLANILHIPAPPGYQVVERTSTPPSQKLGLYRTKDKDGKEGAPIDIQSILNGAAKFCRHCDVVILSNLIRKRASDLPFLNKEELAENGDDLYFCSSNCYVQFALMHRSPSISQDKAAAIIDHLCNVAKGGKDPTRKAKHRDTSDTEEKDFKKTCVKEEKVEGLEMKLTVKKELDADVTDVKEHFRTIKIKLEEDATPPLADVKQEPGLLDAGTKRPLRHCGADEGERELQPPPPKQWKGVQYKYWSPSCHQPPQRYKRPTEKEITELLFRMGITMMPAKIPDDTRKCLFCHQVGDSVTDGPARLLNFDVDKWVHLNCALWSDDVYETVNGALMNLENALQLSLTSACVLCLRTGATIRCFKPRCSSIYHLSCAVKDSSVFFKNKSVYCTAHVPKNEKDNELTTLSVFRRVYVNRDENRQVAAVMHHTEQNNLLRVGSLIFLNVGQLLPHQLHNFHTPNFIYPIGYKIIRFYWSMRVPNKRCRYVCSIHDVAGRPEFRVLVQEPSQDDLELRDVSPRAVWTRILEPMATLRREMCGVQVFPRYVSGEDLFGLTEPAVVRVLESLPGVETLTDYRFKYGRNPLLELPLAINPTGCARSEPKLRSAFPWKRQHTQRTGSYSRPVFVPTATLAGEASCPYSKQFVHSKSSQYKKMKQEWRNNVYLARSKIQGLGLYAARDLERHTMVIEYIGEVIRHELSEIREKQYEAKNRGIYMFRLDEERVVDATLSGGLARYINHSCNPNCVAEIVEVERDLRIIIFAKRRITRGEELAYDYKFDIEDDQHKIPCNCGAPNCRKWMN